LTSGSYGKGYAYHLFDNAKNAEEFDAFVSKVKELGFYDIPVTAEYGDKLITLSTCDKTSMENGRLVVVAKRIK
jgi:sortase B